VFLGNAEPLTFGRTPLATIPTTDSRSPHDNDPAIAMIRTELEIINRLGLHARAAAKFVTCATGFASAVQVERDGRRVNGKSIMGVMMLAAACGSSIVVEVDGDDEEAATAALAALVKDRFGEGE
jgi:phosphocarrier protein HPr